MPDALPRKRIELARKTLWRSEEIRQAQFKVEQATYSKRLQKAQYIPEVGIRYLFFSPFTPGFSAAINSLGVQFKWDIYDWGYKKHLMDEKQRQIEQSQLNLTETSSQVVIDVGNRYRKLREARASLNVAQLEQDAEKQKLDVVLEQYKQKATLLSNLQTEQANMAQAAAQYQQALANFWSARRFRKIDGRGLDAETTERNRRRTCASIHCSYWIAARLSGANAAQNPQEQGPHSSCRR